MIATEPPATNLHTSRVIEAGSNCVDLPSPERDASGMVVSGSTTIAVMDVMSITVGTAVGVPVVVMREGNAVGAGVFPK